MSQSKAKLIGCLLTYWACSLAGVLDGKESAAPSSGNAAAGTLDWGGMCHLLGQIHTWSKNLSSLHGLQLHCTLSTAKKGASYNRKSLKAYKSLKVFKYFSSGFVWNIWSHSHKKTHLVATRQGRGKLVSIGEAKYGN